MPTDTSPLVGQIKDLGFASGVLTYRGTIDFGAGTVTNFPEWSGRGLIAPQTVYNGDALSAVLQVRFGILMENISGFDGGSCDSARLVMGAPGSSNINVGAGSFPTQTAADTGNSWDGSINPPPNELVYEGGLLTSTTGNGSSWYLGRIYFQAIGIKA